jgi:pimeloyl-ACP methyl ester carboxylesterase
MVGELDLETPVAYGFELADLIPGARLVVIPLAGHLLNAEAPEAVNRVLEQHTADELEGA